MTRPSVRQALFLGASLGALTLGNASAHAQSMFVRRTVDPAAQAARAAQEQAARTTNASAIAQRTLQAFARSMAARSAANGVQAAARAAAASSQAALAIPNGLVTGGLKIAPGAVIDTSAITSNTDPRLANDALWVGAKGPTQSVDGGTTNVTIEQTQQKAILNWETFNVGKDTNVHFDQRAGGTTATEWIALNRITDPNAAPSKIFGQIKAEGQVYLINRNGIVFGGTSQVNVHSIVASSLDIAGATTAARNGKFFDGILFNPDEFARSTLLTFGEQLVSNYVNPSPSNPEPVQPADTKTLPGETFADDDGVTIAAGARITTLSYGRALIAGHTVINAGQIDSPDGQVVLAAGGAVYLARNIATDATPFGDLKLDPDLRGVISNVDRGGRVENSGIITSDRGNVTLNAKSIIQGGFVAATTSASQNGSITFKAQDNVIPIIYPRSYVGGSLTLLEGSTTQILPDNNGEKAIGFDQFRPSKIEMLGRYVTFEDNSTLYAPGANVVVDVQRGQSAPLDFVRDPATGQPVIDPDLPFRYLTRPDDARIYVGSGARIDISGLRGVDVAVSQNTIQGELRANELRDNPVLRDSFLRGRDVYFDARKGTAIADLTGNYDLIERNVDELMTTGGSLQFKGAEVVTRQGSIIDLSGGSLAYTGGFVRSSLLVDSVGNVVRIEDAKAGVDYVGLYGDTTITHPRWGVSETYYSPFFRPDGRYEAGYDEGRSAGTLRIGNAILDDNNSPPLESDYRILDGDVLGDVVVGVNQREKSTGATGADLTRVWRERPQGAALIVGVRNAPGNGVNYYGGNITIGKANPLAPDFRPDTPLDDAAAFNYVLPDRYFDGKTFANVTLYSGITDTNGPAGGHLTIGKDVTVDLGDFGSFSFDGTQADIDGTIRAANGSVRVNAVNVGRNIAEQLDWADVAEGDRPRIALGQTAVIDVAGHWVNDFQTIVDRPVRAIDGGTVSLLTSNDLDLGTGALIDVSGGGQLASDGETLTPGNGGAITLVNTIAVGDVTNALQGPGDGVFNLGADLRGYALGRGGTLTIATGQGVVVSDTPVLNGNVLEAGQAAPVDFALAAATLFPAGTFVPVATSVTISIAPSGTPLTSTFQLQLGADPIVPMADWVVPDGAFVRDTNFAPYSSGSIVPAGTILVQAFGPLAAGYTIPADVFPDGLPVQPQAAAVPPGIAAQDITLAAGTIIPKGAIFDQAIASRPLLALNPGVFQQNGFVGYSIAGAGGVTVLADTIVMPTTDSFIIDRGGAAIETGTRLYDVARRGTLPLALTSPATLVLSGTWFDLPSNAPFLDSQLALAASPGRVLIEDGVQIRMTPGSTVNLQSRTGIDINGTIATPGGAIVAAIGGSVLNASSLRLGAQAQLLAPGYVRTVRDGITDVRQVMAGGTVTLGFSGILAEEGARSFVTTDAKSKIDVSGIQATADLLRAPIDTPAASTGYDARLVDGAGGSVTITGSDGVIAGNMNLAPGGATGRGGRLQLVTANGAFNFAAAREGAPTMTVTQRVTEDLAARATGETQDLSGAGLTVIADRLNASGADDLRLTVTPSNLFSSLTGTLLFDGDVSLATRRSITINSPVIAGRGTESNDVDIRSGYVSFTPRVTDFYQPAGFAALGTETAGSFSVRADMIDFADNIDFGCASTDCAAQGISEGFDRVNLTSAGDIRLSSADGSGQLRSPGAIRFTAGQVYSVTTRPNGADQGSDFLIQSGTSVRFVGNGKQTTAPLTYGSRLTVRAPQIVQGGVLRAPYGEITLEASDRVTLLPGSLTSISQEGGIAPAGIRLDGFGGEDSTGPATGATITLNAPDVAVNDGAIIDVSGTGDLIGYQFVAGNGGSRDILDPGSGYFAVSPRIGAGTAPLLTGIPSLQSAGGLSVGDVVHLDGIDGLAAGDYTLLPAQFALTEGAVLIRPSGAGNFSASPATFAQPDGSSVVGGYQFVPGTPIRDAGYRRFEVLTPKVFATFAQLDRFSFNDFIADRNAQAVASALGTNTTAVSLRSARDAGRLVLSATNSLVLDGDGRFAASNGGLLGGVDIAAPQIAIVGGGETAPDGFLTIDAAKLNAFGAGSLFIGGTRATTEGGNQLTVVTTDLIVANDAGSALVAPEILLGATNNLTFAQSATVTASGAVSNETNALLIDGDGALVRLSTGDRVGVIRNFATGSAGTLDIGSNAVLTSSGSLSLDGSANLLIDADARFDAVKLDLGSVKISLGDVPSTITGTVFSNAALANLGTAADLLFRGSESIDLYGAVSLGARDGTTATLGAVTFDTGLLQGIDGGTSAAITAGTITLRNSGVAALSDVAAGNGTLVLEADTLVLGPGEVDIGGFGGTNVRAGLVQARGLGGLDIAGAATIITPLVTAAAGSDFGLRATGDLAFTGSTAAAPAMTDFGGRLSVAGNDVLIDTRIGIPAGIFEATAARNLTLGTGATIDATGVTVAFRDVMRSADGGVVRLNAGGAIRQEAGSSIIVSGDSLGGDAGWIAVTSGGQTSLGGSIAADSADGYKGGGFTIDAGSLDDFGALNTKLETAGFDQARSIRVATGDLTLAAGQTLTAHDVVLRADTGLVTVAGAIDARGSAVDIDGGSVRLIGGSGLSLGSGSRIDASAAPMAANGFPAQSGSVEFVASGGRVSIAQGAVVDVSGGKQGGGDVLIRANRDGNDIAIDPIGGQFVGARDLGVAGVRSYQAAAVDDALVTEVLGDAAAWMANAGAIRTRLGNPAFEIRPGVVIESAGDLTIGTTIDLSTARYGADAPGYLDFRAAGDIAIDGTISDGFASADRSAALNSGRSWSYGFDAGRDVTLGAGQLVRTGTGDIRIDSGRDLVLVDPLSTLYTAGSKTPTAPGFVPIAGKIIGEFPTLGGDISLNAGRDILAPITQQALANWLFRYGETNWTGRPDTSTVVQQTSFSVVFANFEQGVGALGGGNVDVSAGRDVSQLSVSLPTTGHMTRSVGDAARDGDIVVRGGGDLTVTAGRDLLGGNFMLGEGEGRFTAGDAIKASDTLVTQRTNFFGSTEQRKIGALFALMDASADLVARQGVEIEAAFDPIAIQRQTCENLGTCGGFRSGDTAFYSHTERTAITVQAVSGDIVDHLNPYASADLTLGTGDREVLAQFNDSFPFNGTRVPGTVKMVALQGDIALTPSLPQVPLLYSLSPTDNGGLEMLAAGGLTLSFSSGNEQIVMLDVAAPYRRGPLQPLNLNGVGGIFQLPTAATNFDRGFVPTHLNDPDPVRLYAMTGANNFATKSPKPLSVYGALGIPEFTAFTIQHNRPDQVSYILGGSGAFGRPVIAGPGRIVAEGTTGMVTSAGNYPNRSFEASPNLALPATGGADIYIMSGADKPTDYAAFASAYLDPANGEGVVRTYLPELQAYLKTLGFTDQSESDAIARFSALPVESQKPFLQTIFFTELQQTGIDVTDPDSPRFQNYQRGYQAIARLFPLDPTTIAEEDLANFAGGAESQAGGNITILAPYGGISLGAPTQTDPNAGGGVITRKGGDIRIMADRNIDLFLSRVFTLQGGDITMWTSNGDITAGAGAKTTTFRPPLVFNLSNDALTSLNVFGLQTGAGIGVLDAGGTGTREASRLDLIAPRGEVNAGDAGIRVTGDLNIAALRVVGLDNIQVTGQSTGLPEVVQVNVGALTAASATASAVSKAAEAVAQRDRPAVARDIPSIITSRFLGFGDG